MNLEREINRINMKHVLLNKQVESMLATFETLKDSVMMYPQTQTLTLAANLGETSSSIYPIEKGIVILNAELHDDDPELPDRDYACLPDVTMAIPNGYQVLVFNIGDTIDFYADQTGLLTLISEDMKSNGTVSISLTGNSVTKYTVIRDGDDSYYWLYELISSAV